MKYANLIFWVVLCAVLWTVHWHRFGDFLFISTAFLARMLVTRGYKRFGPSANPNAKMGDLLETIREKYKLPSLAAAIVTTDGVVDMAATGVRKVGASIPSTTNDLWHLGSCTKAMTALLAGTFVAEGKLAWEDKVASFFSDTTGQLSPMTREITVAQLLSHRAGIAENYPRDLAAALRGPITEQRITAARWLLQSPAYPPGNYHYSNGGYVVMGSILERLGGKCWEELMRERIFDPMGMTSAGFGGTGTVGEIDQPWPHLANGQPVLSNGPAMDNLPYMGPAGTVHASMSDWGKFLADQLRGGSGQPALLSPSIYATMQRPAKGTYGFGWIVVYRSWARGNMLSHAGSNTMNYAASWLGPAVGYGVLVCTNQGGKLNSAANEVAGTLLNLHAMRPRTKIGRERSSALLSAKSDTVHASGSNEKL
jgi:CubicO group peptidase (beta-lactamase class C family)